MKAFLTTYSALLSILPEIPKEAKKKFGKNIEFYYGKSILEKDYSKLIESEYKDAEIYGKLPIVTRCSKIVQLFSMKAEEIGDILESAGVVDEKERIINGYHVKNKRLKQVIKAEDMALKKLEELIRSDKEYSEYTTTPSFDKFMDNRKNPFYTDMYLIEKGSILYGLNLYKLFIFIKHIMSSAKEALYFDNDLIIKTDELLESVSVDKNHVDRIVMKNDMEYAPYLETWFDVYKTVTILTAMSRKKIELDCSKFDKELEKFHSVAPPIFTDTKYVFDSPPDCYLSEFFLIALHFIANGHVTERFYGRYAYIYPLSAFKETIKYFNDSGLFDDFLETVYSRYKDDYSYDVRPDFEDAHRQYIDLFKKISKTKQAIKGWEELDEAVLFFHNTEE